MKTCSQNVNAYLQAELFEYFSAKSLFRYFKVIHNCDQIAEPDSVYFQCILTIISMTDLFF